MLDCKNYFKLLLVDTSFSIDCSILEKNYLDLQKKYHPDRASDPIERKQFSVISSRLNHAYSTLKNDVDRAAYILSTKKINIDSYHSDRLSRIVRGVFEENELLADISKKEDLERFILQKNIQKNRLLSDLKKDFEGDDMEEFAIHTIHLKYVCRMMSSAEGKLAKM